MVLFIYLVNNNQNAIHPNRVLPRVIWIRILQIYLLTFHRSSVTWYVQCDCTILHCRCAFFKFQHWKCLLMIWFISCASAFCNTNATHNGIGCWCDCASSSYAIGCSTNTKIYCPSMHVYLLSLTWFFFSLFVRLPFSHSLDSGTNTHKHTNSLLARIHFEIYMNEWMNEWNECTFSWKRVFHYSLLGFI